MLTGLLGDALGHPPPGKLKPSARHNYCMGNYTIPEPAGESWAGARAERQGFGTVTGSCFSEAEFERKRVIHLAS